VNERKLEKMLERIEQTLQHLTREDRQTREELREIQVKLDQILALVRPAPSYPQTVAITTQSN
jgi:DNA-binding protein H-NS